MKKTIFVMIVAVALISTSAMAKNEPGLTEAPDLLRAGWNADSLAVLFTEVEGAVKYSVEISGMVTYGVQPEDPNLPVYRETAMISVDICVRDMDDTDDPNVLAYIPDEEVLEEILEELADMGVTSIVGGILLSGDIYDDDTENDDVMVMVKGLNPGKAHGSKRQDNPFSDAMAVGNRVWYF